MTIAVGDYVEVKEYRGRWKWTGRKGHVTEVSRYCAAVSTDDGKQIRDVYEHLRPAEVTT